MKLFRVVLLFVLIKSAYGYTVPVKIYNVENGLSDSKIYLATQDEKGFLWIATSYGVSRFDGYSFTRYASNSGLAGNAVSSIAEDDEGRIWISCKKGLTSYKNNVFKIHELGQDTDEKYILTIATAGDIVWLGTKSGLLRYDRRGNDYEKYLEGVKVISLYVDKKGVVWAGTREEYMYKWNGKEFNQYGEEKGLTNPAVFNFYETKDKGLWICTNDGVFIMKNDEIVRRVTTEDGLSNKSVFDVAEDLDGKIWISTYGGGVNVLHEDKMDYLSKKEGLSSNYIYDVFIDRENNAWVSTNNGLCKVTDYDEVRKYDVRDGLSDNYIYSISEDGEGTLWIATIEGLDWFANGRFTRIDRTWKLPHQTFRCLYYDETERKMWIGSDRGLFYFQDGEVFPFHFQKDICAVIVSIFKDAKGYYWFGSRKNGLFSYDGEKVVHYHHDKGFDSDYVTKIMEDDRKNIWIGTRSGLYRYLKGGFKFYDFVGNRVINDMVIKNDTVLWLATDEGLMKIKGGKVSCFTEADGLSGNQCLFIYPGTEIDMVGNTRGVNLMELDSLKNNGLNHVCVVNKKSGLASSTNTDLYKDGRNRYWLASREGLSMMKGGFGEKNLNVPVYVVSASVRSNGVNREILDSSSIEYDHNDVAVKFIALYYSSKFPLEYEYRLLPDKEWKTTENTNVDFLSLGPGDYEFQVTLDKRNGKVKSSTASFHFKITPPFWKTWWFKGLLVLFILINMYFGISLYSSYRLKQADERRIKEEIIMVKDFQRELLSINEELSNQKKEIADKNEELAKKNRILYENSIRDSLTKAYNHTYGIERLSLEIKQAVENKLALSCLMLDLDHFKSVNDQYGHQAGDRVLKKITSIIKKEIRETDILSRYGGEEFLIILPNVNKKEAHEAAERIRKKIGAYPFDNGFVSVSIGLSSFPDDCFDSALDCVGRADQALYEAKGRGRDRVFVL